MYGVGVRWCTVEVVYGGGGVRWCNQREENGEGGPCGAVVIHAAGKRLQ